MKGVIKKIVTIVATFAIAFAALPASIGDVNVNAASIKAPAQVKNLKATTVTQVSVKLNWSKIAKNRNTKGYAIYRNGKLIKRVSYKTNTFTDTKLKAGTKYSYSVRAYNTYKQSEYYNSKNKKWQTKKPAKKYWKACPSGAHKGKKQRSVTKYKYGKASASKVVTTAKPAAKTPSKDKTPATDQSPSTQAPTQTQPQTGNTETQTVTIYDYKGSKRTVVKGSSDYSNPRYNKTIDGVWSDNGKWIQKNGVTIQFPDQVTADSYQGKGSVQAKVYNDKGDVNKVKLRIREKTETCKEGSRGTVAGPATYQDMDCVFINDNKGEMHRLISFKEESNTIKFFPIEMYGYGVDGYMDGKVHIDIYYDYDGNGSWENNESIGTTTVNVKASKRSVKALEIGKAAVKDCENNPEKYSRILNYNFPDWLRDIHVITQFFEENYSYYNDSIDGSDLNARCTGGAELLRIWIAYKYHVYGYVGSAQGAAAHVAFYPGKDAVEKGLIPQSSENSCHYDAQGTQEPRRKEILNLKVTRNGDNVHASWNKVNGATSYYINTGGVYNTITNTSYDFNFADNKRTNNYTVKVVAYDSEMFQIGCEQVTFYEPAVISNITTTLSEDKKTVTIKWDAVKGADHYHLDALGYEIYEPNLKKNSYSFDYMIYWNNYQNDITIYAIDSSGDVIASANTSFSLPYYNPRYGN